MARAEMCSVHVERSSVARGGAVFGLSGWRGRVERRLESGEERVWSGIGPKGATTWMKGVEGHDTVMWSAGGALG